MAEQVQPWEKQPHETGKAYEAFLIYRDLGQGRTYTAVATKLQKSYTLIRRWKGKYDWEQRASAYDKYLDRQAGIKSKETIAKTRERQLKIAMQLEVKALKALETIEPEDLSPRDVKELLRLATDLEHRLILHDEEKLATQEEGQRQTLADSIVAAYQARMEGDRP